MSAELDETTERLGTHPLGRLLLRLSLPSVASMITMSLYSLVDTFWVAKLGYQAIAATTIIFPYFILAIAVGVGSGIFTKSFEGGMQTHKQIRRLAYRPGILKIID